MLLASRVDGQDANAVPIDDRGLAYGDGLFETMRVARGRVPLLDGHLQRLALGAEALQLPVDISQVERELRELVGELVAAGHAACVVKLVVTRGSGGRGYLPPPDAVPRRLLLASPLPDRPAAYAQDGIALHECRTRLGTNPALAGIKHLNRLEQVLARSEWQGDDFGEGLLRDQEGRVVECVAANLFLVHDGGLVTPRLHRCGVAGVMRGWLLARALSLGIALQERDVTREELDDADELFVCNSVAGVLPVRAIGARRMQPGPLTRRLQAEAARLWQG